MDQCFRNRGHPVCCCIENHLTMRLSCKLIQTSGGSGRRGWLECHSGLFFLLLPFLFCLSPSRMSPSCVEWMVICCELLKIDKNALDLKMNKRKEEERRFGWSVMPEAAKQFQIAGGKGAWGKSGLNIQRKQQRQGERKAGFCQHLLGHTVTPDLTLSDTFNVREHNLLK